MTNIFTYGTLMFDRVWSRVVRGRYPRYRATLEGFRRRLVRGEAYPGIIPGRADDVVRGVVYEGVSSADIERLDLFEGDCYEKRLEECTGEDGRSLPALVYVFKEECRGLLDTRDWDPAWFAREGIAQFLESYPGSRRLAG